LSKNEHDNIGPGSYNPQLPSSKFYPSFSFGYKFSNEIENKNPGPGTYTKEEVNLSLTEGDSKNETLPKINSENQLKSQKTLKTENATPKNKKKKLASKKTWDFQLPTEMIYIINHIKQFQDLDLMMQITKPAKGIVQVISILILIKTKSECRHLIDLFMDQKA